MLLLVPQMRKQFSSRLYPTRVFLHVEPLGCQAENKVLSTQTPPLPAPHQTSHNVYSISLTENLVITLQDGFIHSEFYLSNPSLSSQFRFSWISSVNKGAALLLPMSTVSSVIK